MIVEWPLCVWCLKQVRKIFPPAKRYRITENPDELGYFLEEIKEEEEVEAP